MTAQPPLLSAIEQSTSDLRVQLAMVFGSMEEGGFYGPWGTTPTGPAVGDYGHSYGPFQVNLPYHPGVSAQQAADPYFASGYMVNAYRRAVASIPDSLWKSNPELATEEAAVAAERPAQPYINSHGQAQVDQAYEHAVKLLGGANGASGGGPTYSSGVYTTTTQPGQRAGAANAQTAAFGIPGTGGGGVVGWLTGGLADLFNASGLQDLVERGALIMLGGLLLLIGLIMLVKDTSAGKEAATGAKAAAATGAAAAVAA